MRISNPFSKPGFWKESLHAGPYLDQEHPFSLYYCLAQFAPCLWHLALWFYQCLLSALSFFLEIVGDGYHLHSPFSSKLWLMAAKRYCASVYAFLLLDEEDGVGFLHGRVSQKEKS
ncbi:hypothetical protein AMTRI_Chr05g67210 [Amborella trichopoda]